jgi:hypothetical protein
MIILETFYKNEKNKYIYLLPFMPFLLVNFHAAFLPMFVIVCMPYLFEYLVKKDKRFSKLLLLFIVGIFCSLINPYGIDAVVYGVSSYGAGNTVKVIREMMPFDLGNDLFLFECMLYLAVFLISNTINSFLQR